jgi:hypothetical protein
MNNLAGDTLIINFVNQQKMETPVFYPSFFMWLGPYKWPLYIVSAIVFALVIKKCIDLFFRKGLNIDQLRSGHNAILFWGGFGMALGVFGQLSGIYYALDAIIRASDISPPILIQGFLGSFMTTYFGAGILLVASLSWWLLGLRLNYLVKGSPA